MNNIITQYELWNLPNEQIAELSKGRLVRIVINNGERQESVFRIFLQQLTILICLLAL